MAEHGAFGTPGRSRRVQHAGEIIGAARHRCQLVGCTGLVRQAPRAVGVEGEERDGLVAGGDGERLDPRTVTDEDGGLGVADEVLDLGWGVPGVEGDEGEAGTHTGEGERERFGGLLHLDGDAVAGGRALLDECRGHPSRERDHLPIRPAGAVGEMEEGAVVVRSVGQQPVEEVVGHAFVGDGE